MNFFKQLEEKLTQGYRFNMSVEKKDGAMNLIIDMRGTGKDAPQLSPITITGAGAEELDREFFTAITQPAKKMGMVVNTDAFNKSADTAISGESKPKKETSAQRSKREKEEKEAKKKQEKEAKLKEKEEAKAEPIKALTPMQAKIKEYVDKADAAVEKKDWFIAIEAMNKALSLDPKNEELKTKLNDIRMMKARIEAGLTDAPKTLPKKQPKSNPEPEPKPESEPETVEAEEEAPWEVEAEEAEESFESEEATEAEAETTDQGFEEEPEEPGFGD